MVRAGVEEFNKSPSAEIRTQTPDHTIIPIEVQARLRILCDVSERWIDTLKIQTSAEQYIYTLHIYIKIRIYTFKNIKN